MASDFIYFLSSLPSLQFSGENAPSKVQFQEHCRSVLNEHECAFLSRVSLIPGDDAINEDLADGNATLQAWNNWSTVMLNAISKWRMQRLSEKIEGIVPAFMREEKDAFPGDLKRLASVLENPDARQRQDGWEKMQWDFITQLENAHYFDFESVICYALKIELLEQRRRYDADTGRQVLDRTIDRLTKEAVETRTAVE